MIRRSLDEIYARARAELRDNPTITVYTFYDGIERRRPADPCAGVRATFRRWGEAFISVTAALKRFEPALLDALAVKR